MAIIISWRDLQILSDFLLFDVQFCPVPMQLDLYARNGQGAEASEAYSDVIQKLGKIVKSYG